MALPEVTYADMTTAFGQAVAEGRFVELLPFAVGVVRELTWPNEPFGLVQNRMWRRAVCAALLADAEGGGTHGAGTGGGFTIGKFSVSGGGSAGGSDQTLAAMRGAARRELVGSGLLCMAVGQP